MVDIKEILKERGENYGDFERGSNLAAAIQDAMAGGVKAVTLKPFQHQALTVIAQKISRILNGDPDYVDNWRDIAGYATLVADILEQKAKDGA